jgi:hypothetical protein
MYEMIGITISESIYYLPPHSDRTDPCVLPTSHSSGIWNIFSKGKSDRNGQLHNKENRVQSVDKLVLPQGKFKKTPWSPCIRGKLVHVSAIVLLQCDFHKFQ